MAKIRWDEVALVAAKRGYVLCRSDEGFSLAIDDGTGDEVMQGEKPRYWATLKAIRAWLVARPSSTARAALAAEASCESLRRPRKVSNASSKSANARDPRSRLWLVKVFRGPVSGATRQAIIGALTFEIGRRLGKL
jgi:hypothetical protein